MKRDRRNTDIWITCCSIPSAANMSINEWIGVLRLAQMWSFEEERQKAIDMLEELLGDGNLVRKLNLAREFDISEWLQPICEELTTCTTALTPDQIPRLEPAFFHDVGRAREAHYKAILYRILDVFFRPMCSCGAELGAPDERLVQKGPEWYYKCNTCARNFTLDDAIRMTAQLRQMAVVSKMKDDTSQIVNSVLVQPLLCPDY